MGSTVYLLCPGGQQGPLCNYCFEGAAGSTVYLMF